MGTLSAPILILLLWVDLGPADDVVLLNIRVEAVAIVEL